MKRLKQRYLWLTLVVLAIGFTVFSGVKSYQQSQLKAYGQEFSHGYYTGQEKLKTYQFIEDRRALAIEWETITDRREDKAIKGSLPKINETPVYVGKRYIVRENAKLRHNPESHKFKYIPTSDDEYWTIDIYDTEDLSKSPRTVDLLKKVQTEKNQMIQGSYGIYLKDGQEQLIIGLLTSTQEKRFKSIDLETGKIQTLSSKSVYDALEYDGLSSLYSWNSWKNASRIIYSLNDKLMNRNIDVSWQQITVSEGTSLPKSANKWLLNKNYPKASDILKNNGDIYLLDATYDDKGAILSLFFPSGTNIYEGVKIPSEYSIDGQEHIINSYEELLQYYKDSEE